MGTKSITQKPKSSRRQIAIAIAVAVGIAGFLFGAVTASFVVGSASTLSAEKINISAQLIIQFVSFLTAGWVVAFFWYWGGLQKAVRKSRRSRMKLKAKEAQDAVQFKNTADGTLYALMQQREREYEPTGRLFGEALSSVIGFIASAFSSVIAVLIGDGWLIVFSLALLAFGVSLMFASWFDLWWRSRRLRVLSDFAETRTG